MKTDRRDAAKLARCHRSGDLTSVWVPDKNHEALRDLVRRRETAFQDRHRARQRFGKFLLRHGDEFRLPVECGCFFTAIRASSAITLPLPIAPKTIAAGQAEQIGMNG